MIIVVAAFWTQCITVKVADGRNIDLTMRLLEGPGVTRRHGRCAACGNARLVASVSSTI